MTQEEFDQHDCHLSENDGCETCEAYEQEHREWLVWLKMKKKQGFTIKEAREQYLFVDEDDDS